MIHIEANAEGVVLPVRVHAGARRNAVVSRGDGSLGVCVTQAPEKGKANRAVIDLLARQLRLRKSQIAIISGESSRQKRFLVREISQAELLARIEATLNAASE